MTLGNIRNIEYMGITRKFGNMGNIENFTHEPATTIRKNNNQSDKSMSRNSNSIKKTIASNENISNDFQTTENIRRTNEERSEGLVHKKQIRDDDNTAMKPTKNKKSVNKLGLSWAKLSHSWGLKLEFEVKV